jgi:hypothetical protein
VDGPLGGVTLCHCVECRRWAGHVWASTPVHSDHLVVSGETALRWIDSPESDAHARRGFCGECGSSLFWDAPDQDSIWIAAGSLDTPTGLRIEEEVYKADASDYY